MSQWIQAAIALGGNLGDSQRILSEAMEVIGKTNGIRMIARSPLYKTAPVGPPQPDYLNACLAVETGLSARSLLHQLLAIENQFGRVRHERWGARSLDLDLLLFGDQIIDLPGLTVPHPRLHERAFVLVPLMDVAPHIVPEWSHPIFGKTIAQLSADLLAVSSNPGIERLMQSSLPPLSSWH
ncbi:MAG: 2-amino-4-hydroxy-6-hydroxymethyldihydropteridine diphosphokinase [Phormidesmis sp.]